MSMDIGWTGMLVVYLLLLVPLLLLWRLRTGLAGEALLAAIRMTVQLTLVGLYLRVIFDGNNPWLIGLWVGVMVLVANHAVLGKAGLNRRLFFGPTLVGIAASSLGVAAVMVAGVVRPETWLDARYIVPLVGMVLGNCLRGNTLVLERFYSSIHERETEWLTRLTLGASLREAAAPFAITALRAALMPMVATMATMGLVSLPGMMTGQILGGAAPMIAIKYQIMIMVAILCAMSLSAVANLWLSMRKAFDEFGNLRMEVFGAGHVGSGGSDAA
jgi:putative ABC transport system permease protein